MKFDVFFSICQNEVDAYTPSERMLFENFFDQVQLADALGFETAWVAESHLSSEIQKQNRNPVIPFFKGEVGLNTDIVQLAYRIFAKTKRIEVGSAIRNILCNGGPLAHAESIRFFLALHSLEETEQRKLQLGFASGRFDYSNRPYGVAPRNKAEECAWSVLKPKVFLEAVQIFCKALRGDVLSSEDITKQFVKASDFKNPEQWTAFQQASHTKDDSIPLAPFWNFEKLRVVPNQTHLDLLSLTIGSHDPKAQQLANTFLPVKVFNLSITPTKTIEETHDRMSKYYHTSGGPWKRHYMPRTVLVFLEAGSQWSSQEKRSRAQERARKTLEVYWQAVEGTLNPERIQEAVQNSLCGSPEDIAEQICERFHPHDRLMLWFDFNCHDNELVKNSMRAFAETVIPLLKEENAHEISMETSG